MDHSDVSGIAYNETLQIMNNRDLIRPAIQEFLARFPAARHARPGIRPEITPLIERISSGLQQLEPVVQRPNIGVSWTLGAGRWKRRP